MSASLEELKYPIGAFVAPPEITPTQITEWILEIEQLPARLRQLVEPYDSGQLDTQYRPEGWTVRQVVHHLGDSHMNSYVRFKWALTEDQPEIKPYMEAKWAELADYRETPLEISLSLLDSLHARWCVLLRSLDAADWEREFIHPDMGVVSLATNVGIYAWHGNHHFAHIYTLAQREGW